LNIIEQHKEALIALCKKHHVKSLFVFGSVLRNDFKEDSDVDFSVLFDKSVLGNSEYYVDNYFDFIENLEKELSRHVDLVSEEIKSLNTTKKLFYAA
jgi:uncharacterized protein